MKKTNEDEDEDEELELDPNDYPLLGADPDCEHDIVLLWSGYKCSKCPGWFCL